VIPGVRLSDLNRAMKDMCVCCRQLMERLHVVQIDSLATERLLELRREVCKEWGISEADLLRPSKVASVVKIRRDFAKRARAGHYGFHEISKALGRHHSTVISLVHGKKQHKRVRR